MCNIMCKYIAVICAPLFLLAACASAPVVSLLPQEDGSFKTIASAGNEQEALRGSLRIAESTCLWRNQHHQVASVNTLYRGIPMRPQDAAKRPEQLTRYVNGPTFPSINADDDYQVLMQFKCV